MGGERRGRQGGIPQPGHTAVREGVTVPASGWRCSQHQGKCTRRPVGYISRPPCGSGGPPRLMSEVRRSGSQRGWRAGGHSLAARAGRPGALGGVGWRSFQWPLSEMAERPSGGARCRNAVPPCSGFCLVTEEHGADICSSGPGSKHSPPRTRSRAQSPTGPTGAQWQRSG